ncbi:dermonecrotic toxin domain-containing protein [Pseudomonas sp. S3_A03]
MAENLGTHHAFIRQKIPAWLAETALPRLTALTATSPADAAPPPELRNAFKTALGEHWSTQNTLDQKLAALNDLRAFAEPRLKTALLPYGDIDVTQTLIRLYAPADLPWWSLDVKLGVKSRTVSLLDAALHNFSASETFEDFAFYPRPMRAGNTGC